MNITKQAKDLPWTTLKETTEIKNDSGYLVTRTSKVRTTFENRFCVQDIKEMEKEALERGQTEIYSVTLTDIVGTDEYGYLVRTR